jgi:pyruvate/2-oxoglutarate dehydrogenase complex dihydrolipoamide acyltransferase (E2) component
VRRRETLAVEVKMPKLGLTMEEGKLLEWVKKEKDLIKKGEALCIIESDKVTYEMESPGSGILVILLEKGEGIPVGTLLGCLALSEEEYTEIRSKAVPRMATEELPLPHREMPEHEGRTEILRLEGEIRATPGARKLAKERGIDLATIVGSGALGRVTREDILKDIDKTPSVSQVASLARKSLVKEESMSSMRATIARRMMQSLQTSAQMTAFSEWDVTELMKMRAYINRSEEKMGFRATIPGLIVAVLARVLKEMPIFNASMEGNTIKYWADVNIGIAVALPDGLVVPVVFGADRRSLKEIHQCMADIISRARQKKLLPDDMSNGTFTLTNLGSYGGEWETIILNPPEVAILAIGQVAQKPMVQEGRIAVRDMMPISLTVDHRVIDGATSGSFRKRMKELVGSPGLVWVETMASASSI